MRAYQRKQFAAASKGAPAAAAPEPELELTAKIERKYKAAQIVETGIQVRSRPCALRSSSPQHTLQTAPACATPTQFSSTQQSPAERLPAADGGGLLLHHDTVCLQPVHPLHGLSLNACPFACRTSTSRCPMPLLAARQPSSALQPSCLLWAHRWGRGVGFTRG